MFFANLSRHTGHLTRHTERHLHTYRTQRLVRNAHVSTADKEIVDVTRIEHSVGHIIAIDLGQRLMVGAVGYPLPAG